MGNNFFIFVTILHSSFFCTLVDWTICGNAEIGTQTSVVTILHPGLKLASA